ncbi:hypothetical protein HNV10_11370 [Winogradskyella litoriviva]|uniref:Uncharacterized protein n=1 Tax=Winogradskyella litoriviva TaxID=1220182 RepID=A0ABX2E815_9FLAO|nr:hypothetical protein [Winogradskyella litoriviva]NRD23846.1 hypothetical protein [Winogradskyella litoriviva]
MKVKVYILLFLAFGYSYSQDDVSLEEIFNKENKDLELINEVLSQKIDSINHFITNTDLRIKLNSELNTIASINRVYSAGHDLITEKNIKELEKRIEFIASYFFRKEKYYLFNFSRGLGSRYGVKNDFKYDKPIIFLTISSGCIITNIHRREEHILGIFNSKMNELLSEI